jgi:hypothetical protein
VSSTSDGATVRHGDARVPDPPTDLLDALDDPAQQAIAAAFWRIGYTACLDTPRTWRDQIPAGVRILHDFDYLTSRDQKD